MLLRRDLGSKNANRHRHSSNCNVLVKKRKGRGQCCQSAQKKEKMSYQTQQGVLGEGGTVSQPI